MSEMKIGRMVLGVCQTNCYFVYREGEGKAIVIDPADYGEKIDTAMTQNGFQVVGILLTHGHFDHIWGCEELRRAVNERIAETKNEAQAAAPEEAEAEKVKVYALAAERELLLDAHKNVSKQAGRACTLEADVYVNDGDEITLAGMTCKVIATPGHTQGGCCYYFEEAGILVCGDTLFLESVGRTDFPTGSMGTLVRSIKEKLFILPDDTVAYPGHGDSTTIGHEKKYNAFLG